MLQDKTRLSSREAGADGRSRGFAADGSPLTFPALLEYCRRTWGGKVAFQHKIRREWRRYTHDEVYARSYALAGGLLALGLKRGERVLMIFENSPDWACSYYAITLAGGVAVPIYYDLKPSEIETMAAHADASMAIVAPKLISKLETTLSPLRAIIAPGWDDDGDTSPSASPSQAKMVSLEGLAAAGNEQSRQQLAAIEVDPDDLASIVFTSGTSGGNKGVMLTHRNFMANCRQVRHSIPFGERDRLVMVLPLHHAFPFIVTVAVAPAVGGEVTFENDLRRIRDRMAEIKPTLFIGVPALFELMYRNIVHGIEAQGRIETFQKGLRIVEATKQRTGINIGRIVFRELHKRLGGSLRFMVSGGAALSPQTTREFAALGVPILQGWGLSEASPVLSAQRWNPRKFYMSNHYEDQVGSIGLPLDGVEIGLIDVPEKELYVHLHGEGELVARGDNITPGYWRSPEASAAIKVGEWLRTGDVGYIDDDGNIWITGRSKFVIVLESGEKVHPDEVEEKLQRADVVEDLVVLGRKVRGKTTVAAVVYPNRDAVVARVGSDALTPELVARIVRDGLAGQEDDVASYKRVVEVMLTDEPLPKTPLRKVMRGRIGDQYPFELGRWERSWRELQDAANPPSPADQEADEVLAGV